MSALAPQVTSAATQSSDVSFSGSSQPLEIFHPNVLCDLCLPDALADPLFTDEPGGDDVEGDYAVGVGVDVNARATWGGLATVDANYGQSKLRQGETLDLKDTLTPKEGAVQLVLGGAFNAGVFVSQPRGLPSDQQNYLPIPSGTKSIPFTLATATVPCAIPLPGDSPRTCKKTYTVRIFEKSDQGIPIIPDVLSVKLGPVDLLLTTTVEVSGTGVATVRKATVSNISIPDRSFTFEGSSPSTAPDPIEISCRQPAGMDFYYDLTNNTYTATQNDASFSGSYRVEATFNLLGSDLPSISDEVPIGLFGRIPVGNVLGPFHFGSIPLAAADLNLNLGPVLPDVTPPVISAVTQVGTFVEGSEIQFSAIATDNCGPDALHYEWRFSDGGTGFSPSTHHRFAGDGHYTATLTVTDATGNSTTKDFHVEPVVANGNPNLIAPPGALAEWGVPVQFHADAIDPGPSDQGTLAFKWNFGDGSGAAGPDVTHTYADSGDYTVGITATDKDGGVGTASTTATISKRATLLIYTGETGTSAGDDDVTFSAVLSDKLGNALVDRTVFFGLGGYYASAKTDDSGVATAEVKAKLKPGEYTVNASFPGDIRHKPTITSTPFRVSGSKSLTSLGPLPSVSVSASGTQSIGGLSVVARPSLPGTLIVQGSVQPLAGGRSATARYRIKRVTRRARAHVRTRMRLRLARKDVRAIKSALRAGRRMRAKVTVTAIAGGKLTTVTKRIRLRR